MSRSNFSQDDFYDEENDIDSQDEEFIEDDLPQDEYDQLYFLLPQIKSHFSQYNNKDINDELLKKTLWLNYFDLNDSINEIKSNYKKIPQFISFTPKCILIGGSSKLALLLQKRLQLRQQQQQQQDGNKLISILDKLSSNPIREVPIVKKVKPIKQESPKPVVVPTKEPEVKETLKLPSMVLDSSLLISCQSDTTKLLTNANKKRKLNHLEILSPIYTNDSILVKKITTNFNKPSPDDIVLQAQSNLFNDIDTKLQKISITPKSKKLKKNDKIDFNKEISKFKPQLSFVIFGHVDSGKSTIIGRMLYDLKIVDSKTLHKLQQESDKIGKGSFALAWIMDQTDEERSRGVTIDIVNTTVETETAKFNIIDSPGHQDFVPQLINGISQADVGVLIIDCNDYENGFNNVKEQVLISKNLGIDNLIIAMNKFDLCQYDLNKLELIIENVKENLIKIGYQERNLKFVPVSGLIGDNITKKSSNFEWPNSLFGYFQDELLLKQENQTSITDEPFIMTINEIVDVNTKELKINGRVNNGVAANGDEFQILPDNAVIKLDQSKLSQLLIKGDFFNNLKFKFIDVTNFELINNGDLITNDIKNFQTKSSLNINLRLFSMLKPLLIGTSFVLFHNCKQYPARITKIESVLNKQNQEVPYKKRHLVSSQIAKVVIELDKPLSYNLQIDKLIRVVIRKDSSIIGCGEII